MVTLTTEQQSLLTLFQGVSSSKIDLAAREDLDFFSVAIGFFLCKGLYISEAYTLATIATYGKDE